MCFLFHYINRRTTVLYALPSTQLWRSDQTHTPNGQAGLWQVLLWLIPSSQVKAVIFPPILNAVQNASFRSEHKTLRMAGRILRTAYTITSCSGPLISGLPQNSPVTVSLLQDYNHSTHGPKTTASNPEALAETGFYYTGLCYNFYISFFEQSIVNLFFTTISRLFFYRS
jgi:hypothetical protein